MTRRLVLSPHPDDAVLSLWHLLSGPGDVAVVNVFAGASKAAAAGWWDALTGATDPRARAAERAAEDREALALAGREPIDLEFVDAQYRKGPQAVEPIADRIDELVDGDTLILVPAALGEHPDHRLTLAAGLELERRGREIALYADVPHGQRQGWPGWVTGTEADGAIDAGWRAQLAAAGVPVERLEPEVHRLAPDEEARKRAAVAAYRTQLGALEARFGLLSRPEILRFEVVWRLAPVPAHG